MTSSSDWWMVSKVRFVRLSSFYQAIDHSLILPEKIYHQRAWSSLPLCWGEERRRCGLLNRWLKIEDNLEAVTICNNSSQSLNHQQIWFQSPNFFKKTVIRRKKQRLEKRYENITKNLQNCSININGFYNMGGGGVETDINIPY